MRFLQVKSAESRHYGCTRAVCAHGRADRIPGDFVVRDTNGQALACVYSRPTDAEAQQAKVH
jgi:hypothetical protein